MHTFLKGRKIHVFKSIWMCVDAALLTGSVFSRKLSLLHRLLGLFIETGKKKQTKTKQTKKQQQQQQKNDLRNNFIFGTPFRSSFLLRSPFRIGECSKHQNSLWSDSHAGQWTTGVV